VAVVDRVHRRRRRRVVGRAATAVAAVALAGGATLVGPALLRHDGGDRDRSRVVTGQDGPDMPSDPDASAFARLLAERSWLADADLDGWPVQPADFVQGPPTPGMGVVGTVAEVRPGPVTTSACAGVPGCVAQTNLEMVVDVDVILPGDQDHPERMVVPWVTGQFTAADAAPDQATSDRLAQPFVDAAPIGARIYLVLRSADGGPYDWRPQEPSGVRLEDPDGVAIPQPDPDAPDLSWTFDDYVDEVSRLQEERLFASAGDGR
jgi:hypothetical protein